MEPRKEGEGDGSAETNREKNEARVPLSFAGSNSLETEAFASMYLG